MPTNPVASLLIVDDEVAQMTALCRTLEPEGYRTTGTTSSREALTLLRNDRFDLILTDLTMADIDGIALLRMAFAIDPQLVGIVMTGHGTVATAVEALKAGALDYILKPFNLSVIKPVLARALAVRQLRTENIQLRETVGMYELSLAIAVALDVETILRELVDAAYWQSHDGEIAILQPSGEAGAFVVAAARGEHAEARLGTMVMLETSAAAWSARTRDTLSRVDELPDIATAFASPVLELAASIALPMLSGGKVVGILCFATGDARGRITAGQIKALNILASTAAAALERQQLEEQLRQAQKMEAIGRLTAGVAHDFNNLLTVISGYAEVALAQPVGADLQPQVLEIKHASEQAATLTHQLLAFGRKQASQPTVLNLNAVVERQSLILRRIIGEDIHLITRLELELAPVRADRAQIEQVLMNLAVNARDAMPDGGTLTIETQNLPAVAAGLPRRGEGEEGGDRSAVSLVVSDTGYGMDDATRARIFEPFFTTKPVGRGTGLGLSVVHGIVTQSEGTIAVETAPGRGTTFRIHLPAVTSSPSAAAASPQPHSTTRGTETILVVEDEATVRQFIVTILEDAGYRVLRARHGSEAVDIYRQETDHIALLVTDLVMPQMSGPALVEALRQLDPELRVIYLSGYADDAFAGLGEPDARPLFLQKPFTGADLLHHVRGALDGVLMDH